jgi:hypothetical protein
VHGEGYLTRSFARYYQGDQINEHEPGRHVARMGKTKNAYKISGDKPERKKEHGMGE